MLPLRPRTLALVATGALGLAACLRAPDPPAGDGDGGPGDAGGPCPALAGLTASDALPVAIGLPGVGAFDDLLVAGAVAGRPALLLHSGGPAFSPACPDRRIDLGDAAEGTVIAVIPHGAGRVLALASTGAAAWLVGVDLATGTSEALTLGFGLPATPAPGLAASGERVRLAQSGRLYGVDVAEGVAGAPLTPLTPLDDTVLAIAAVDPATAGHGWVIAGLGADHVLALDDAVAMSQQDHGPAGCTAITQGTCAPRHVHAVTASRFASADEARIVAVSLGEDGSVITLQNRAVPARRGMRDQLPASGIQDVEITDLVTLGADPLPRLFVAHVVADAYVLSHATVRLPTEAAQLTLAEVGFVAQLPITGVLGPLRLATGRFVVTGVPRTVVLGRDAAGGLAARCYDTQSPAILDC